MDTRELVARWFVAFAITQLVECPVYVRAFGVSPGIAFGASAITHPVVCFVIPHIWRRLYVAAIALRPGFALGDDAYFVAYGALAEGFAVAVEAVYLTRWAGLAARRAWVASIAANAASGLFGLLCSWLFGWP